MPILPANGCEANYATERQDTQQSAKLAMHMGCKCRESLARIHGTSIATE